jgi:cation-transporting ATPase 13A1
VPPELPLELTLAVNNSLVALTKLLIFCTEPFRIPFAGGLDVCCFDKTGTLTEDTFQVEGVAGLAEEAEAGPGDSSKGVHLGLRAPAECPEETQLVMAGCHSLLQVTRAAGGVGGALMGDPLEKQAFEALVSFSVTGSGTVVGTSQAPCSAIECVKRFPFHSSLRRMSVIVDVKMKMKAHGRGETIRRRMALAKGAPEVMRSFFAHVPASYDACHNSFSRTGCRVLALGWRDVSGLEAANAATRDDTERGLTFAGFLVMRCPLKEGSGRVVQQLIDSSHRVVMVTGDHVLTAVHVARRLTICNRDASQTYMLTVGVGGRLSWVSTDAKNTLAFDVSSMPQQALTCDFCVTGDGLQSIVDTLSPMEVAAVASHVVVFARTSPKQKQVIVDAYKSLGKKVSMCGDGTNDVRALKGADVGLALLSSQVVRETNRANARRRRKRVQGVADGKHRKTLEDTLAQGAVQPVRLGDASIAASFTSKVPHVQSMLAVIQQGRCTLVTTHQMYRILALNCLVSSYCLSVLYLDGLKMSDTQMTIYSLGLSGLFFFLSRSKPLRRLSREKPHASLFSAGTMLSLALQFAVHIFCLVRVAAAVNEHTPRTIEHRSSDADFLPNATNTSVFLLYSSMTVTNFIANYHGQPFMEALGKNRGLWWMLYASLFGLFLLAAEIVPEVNELLELTPLPTAEVQLMLLGYMVLDVLACVWTQKILGRLFRNTPPLSVQATSRNTVSH